MTETRKFEKPLREDVDYLLVREVPLQSPMGNGRWVSNSGVLEVWLVATDETINLCAECRRFAAAKPSSVFAHRGSGHGRRGGAAKLRERKVAVFDLLPARIQKQLLRRAAEAESAASAPATGDAG